MLPIQTQDLKEKIKTAVEQSASLTVCDHKGATMGYTLDVETDMENMADDVYVAVMDYLEDLSKNEEPNDVFKTLFE